MGRRPNGDGPVSPRGAKIIELMRDRGLKRADLARLTGEQPQTISKIISGSIEHPGIDKMERIADALRVPLDVLRPDSRGVLRLFDWLGGNRGK